jgi:hypothetical protein
VERNFCISENLVAVINWLQQYIISELVRRCMLLTLPFTFLLLVQKKSNKRKRQHQQSLFYACIGLSLIPPANAQAKIGRTVAAPATAQAGVLIMRIKR